MVIKIKNKALHKRIMKQIDELNDKELVEIKKGNLAKARVYEKRSDRIYAQNYGKMFNVKKVNGNWVLD